MLCCVCVCVCVWGGGLTNETLITLDCYRKLINAVLCKLMNLAMCFYNISCSNEEVLIRVCS